MPATQDAAMAALRLALMATLEPSACVPGTRAAVLLGLAAELCGPGGLSREEFEALAGKAFARVVG